MTLFMAGCSFCDVTTPSPGHGFQVAELSNNLAENSMRPVVLGRKNWLHVGSVDAGPRVAAILSVVESCRRMKLPVRDYLAEVLPGLENRTLSQVKVLTPSRCLQHLAYHLFAKALAGDLIAAVDGPGKDVRLLRRLRWSKRQ